MGPVSNVASRSARGGGNYTLIIRDTWPNCYRARWHKRDVHPDTFAHPAKFQPNLIRRIYEHAFAEGWLKACDSVVDPFGGVALGAFHALTMGLTWIGVELEPEHTATGQANIALWKARYRGMPNLGDAAILLQGDSRTLLTWGRLEPGRGVDAVCGSPPFSAGDTRNRTPYQDGEIASMMSRAYTQDRQGLSTGQLAAMKEGDVAGAIGSPPYVSAQAHPSIGSVGKDQWGEEGKDIMARRGLSAEYGQDPANLASLPEGSLDAAISSPPYTGNEKSDYQMSEDGKTRRRDLKRGFKQGHGCFRGSETYGQTEGQLGSLPEGDFAGVVTSPPYEKSIDGTGDGIDWTKAQRGGHGKESGTPRSAARGAIADGYGAGASNLGNQSGDTFWSAARVIVANCHALLRPGGHAIWVLGPYVRKGQLVDFPAQWQALCGSVGFRTLHVHRCPKVERYGTQRTLAGGDETHTIERVSFFRRLANAKNGTRVDYEDVVCMRKEPR